MSLIEEYYNDIVSLTYNEWLIIIIAFIFLSWLARYLRRNKISLISNKKQKKLQSFNKKILKIAWYFVIPFMFISAFVMWVYEYFVSPLN